MRLLDEMEREAAKMESRAEGYRQCGEKTLAFGMRVAARRLRDAIASVESANAAEGEAASRAAEA